MSVGDRHDIDVVVVGGGLSGMIAARELRYAGLRAVVLEARDRLGGRMWTGQVLDSNVDLGATFLHWTQPHIWAETVRYGLRLTQRPPVTAAVWLGSGRRFTGDSIYALQAFLTPGLAEFLHDAREVFPRPYDAIDSERITAADSQTMADRIRTLSVSDEEKEIIHGYWSVNCNRPCEEAALSHALHWCALTAGDWRTFNEAAARYKLVGGSASLVSAVADDAGADVRLRTQVTGIAHDDNGVCVRTAQHSEFRAGACVVALPLNVLHTITFEPGLALGKAVAIAEGAPRGGFKVWMRLRGQTDSFLCIGSGHETLMFARTEVQYADGCLLSCYGADLSSANVGADTDALTNAVQRWLPGADLEVCSLHDWSADEFSLETWRVPRPGQLTKFADELEQPEGRLVLAGADLARGWTGYMDGAVETGIRSARHVRNLLAPCAPGHQN